MVEGRLGEEGELVLMLVWGGLLSVLPLWSVWGGVSSGT